MRFAQLQFLYALPVVWLVMALCVFAARHRRRKLWKKWVGTNPARLQAGFSSPRMASDYVLWFISVGALLLALARPMYFQRDERTERQGTSYLVALDASRSMLATDVKPSRYAAATNALVDFFNRSGPDQIGLIAFSGVAYLNAPLTFDKTALQTILGYINPETLVDPGTSLGLALDRASRYFTSNSLPLRELIIISDGEDLDPQTLSLARRLHHDQKLVVHTIGVGTTTGASIRAHRADATNSATVTTRLDETSLRRLAYATGGRYFPLGAKGEGLRQLREEVLNELAESSARRDWQNYRECFFVPLAVALLAWIARLLLGGDRHSRHSKLPAIARAAALTVLFCLPAHADDEIADLQQHVNQGQAMEAWRHFDEQLRADPGNRRLLYDRAIAAYAAGELDKAMVDLDQAENGASDSLAAKALFQKGNAEFRLGSAALTNDADATISHWQNSIANYEESLKRTPHDKNSQFNRDVVHHKLFDLLTQKAEEHLQAGMQTNETAAEKIPPLRQAMDQFHQASQMEPQDQRSAQGEQQARDLLANALAEEGVRKTMTEEMIPPTKFQAPVMHLDFQQIQEGVDMLEDAHGLKPEDKKIAGELDEGRERLANALAQQAAIYESIEPKLANLENKLGALRMGMELAEQALDQSPKNQLAHQVLGDIQKRLAQIHEEEGDRLSQESDKSELEEQAQDLEQALDHYQQASELQPQQSQLPKKAAKTQSHLADVLQALGEKLMKGPNGPESPDAEAMRLEGADQALSELQGLRPSNSTAEKARQVSQMLDKLRRKLAQNGIPMPQLGQQPGSAWANYGPPMDAPPRLDAPGVRGVYHSTTMNRSLRDY
ncbi:MAG TPA: VWA domain-containing protein [Verrucomicrobiae bacterium]|jgi:Ca-activated chloride channel family protein